MDKRRILMELLSNLIIFIVFFNFFTTFYAGIHERMDWIYLLSIIPFFLMWVLRKLIKDIIIFIAIHIVFLVLPFFVFSGVELTVTMVLFAFVMVFHSIASMLKGEREIRVFTAILAMLAVWISYGIAGMFLEITDDVAGLSTFAGICAFIILLASVLYIQMENLEFNLKTFESNRRRQADKSVFTVNNILIAVFTGITAVAIIATLFLPGGRLFRAVFRIFGDFIALILRGIVWLFTMLFPGLEFLEPGQPHGPEMELDFDMDYLEDDDHELNDPSIIGGIVGFLLVSGVIVGMVIAVIMLFKLAYSSRDKSKLSKKRPDTDDTVSKLKFSASDLAAFLPKFKIEGKHPVRKAYIKKVNSHIRKGMPIKPSDIPEEIADCIRPVENIDELTKEYNPVRYGRGM